MSHQKSTKTIVDVRTPIEFKSGHAEGSINIPLAEIPNQLDKIKSLSHPIMLCCASGTRSKQAMEFLTQQVGIDCEDGGSWLDL